MNGRAMGLGMAGKQANGNGEWTKGGAPGAIIKCTPGAVGG